MYVPHWLMEPVQWKPLTNKREAQGGLVCWEGVGLQISQNQKQKQTAAALSQDGEGCQPTGDGSALLAQLTSSLRGLHLSQSTGDTTKGGGNVTLDEQTESQCQQTAWGGSGRQQLPQHPHEDAACS